VRHRRGKTKETASTAASTFDSARPSEDSPTAASRACSGRRSPADRGELGHEIGELSTSARHRITSEQDAPAPRVRGSVRQRECLLQYDATKKTHSEIGGRRLCATSM
jgi:hypothetical protein